MGNDESKPSSKNSGPSPLEIIKQNKILEECFCELQLTPETWDKLACLGDDRVFARTKMVKAVVQHFLSDSKPSGPPLFDPILYFLDSLAYKTHVPFCFNIWSHMEQHLKGVAPFDSSDFNEKNYKRFPRNFTLLTIVYYQDFDLYAVELWPGDNLPAIAITQTHDMLVKQTFFGDKLKWRASSPLHERLLSSVTLPGFFPQKVALDSELFGSIKYQPLHRGTTYGICRIWRNAGARDDSASKAAQNQDLTVDIPSIKVDNTGAPLVDRRTILVTQELPLDLNPVRGLVTAQLQTPLCHVALLCSNRGTVNMASKDALKEFAEFEGKLVRLTVRVDDFEVAVASETEEQEWLQKMASCEPPRVCPPLQVDVTTTTSLIHLTDIKLPSEPSSTVPDIPACKAIGSKALNMARILQWDVKNVNYTGNLLSFVIPFYYFHNYVQTVAANEIQEICNPAVEEARSIALCAIIREKIILGKIPAEWKLLEQVQAWMKDWSKTIAFSSDTKSPLYADGAIFRSSTNCEDLPGFPSAGLYESVPVRQNKEGKMEAAAIEAAILRVWASVYLDKAYLERREYQLVEKDVKMAILVMPLLGACVKANGVAVTANPYRADLGGNYLNVQKGTVAVTDACAGHTPEQVMFIRDGFREVTVEYIGHSNLMPLGEHLITSSLATPLNRVLTSIGVHCKIFHNTESRTNAADIEFLILKNDEIVLLQARPVRVQSRLR